jgi:uncharacterized SAM-binding protein YcdF (DUF218 family)
MAMRDLLLTPYWLLGFALMALVAANFAQGSRRLLGLASAAVLCLWWFGATPLTSSWALGVLERRASAEAAACAPPGPHAWFIVLAGGLRAQPKSAQDIGALSAESLRRIIAAVQMARQVPDSRLLISGGMGRTWTEADLMGALAQRLGVSQDRIELERRSRDTLQNAQEVAHMLQGMPSRPLYLVTSAYHMPRAWMSFRRNGLRVCASPVDFQPIAQVSLKDLVPDAAGLRAMSRAIHEYLGILYYRLVKFR